MNAGDAVLQSGIKVSSARARRMSIEDARRESTTPVKTPTVVNEEAVEDADEAPASPSPVSRSSCVWGKADERLQAERTITPARIIAARPRTSLSSRKSKIAAAQSAAAGVPLPETPAGTSSWTPRSVRRARDMVPTPVATALPAFQIDTPGAASPVQLVSQTPRAGLMGDTEVREQVNTPRPTVTLATPTKESEEEAPEADEDESFESQSDGSPVRHFLPS